jgi:hypothetical protein
MTTKERNGIKKYTSNNQSRKGWYYCKIDYHRLLYIPEDSEQLIKIIDFDHRKGIGQRWYIK